MQRERGGRRPAGSEQQVNSVGRASHRKLKVMYVWHADGRGEGDGDGDGAGKQAGNPPSEPPTSTPGLTARPCRVQVPRSSTPKSPPLPASTASSKTLLPIRRLSTWSPSAHLPFLTVPKTACPLWGLRPESWAVIEGSCRGSWRGGPAYGGLARGLMRRVLGWSLRGTGSCTGS